MRLMATSLVLQACMSATVALADSDAAVRLQRCLDRNTHSHRLARWGVVVKELPGGEVLYSHNPNLSFNPASNIKIVTSAAVLDRLGPRYRFVTEVFGKLLRGTVTGGIYLRGSCDPSLTTARLVEMANALRRLGVKAVHGPVYLDISAYEGSTDPDGFRRFRSSHPFRAGVSALSLNHNVIRIGVAPAKKPGAPARVEVDPPSAYLKLRALVRTTSGPTRLHVSTHPRGRATSVSVGGRINIRARARTFWRRVYNPSLYTGFTFISQLRAAGIRVGHRIGYRRVPEGMPRILVNQSPPLSLIVRSGTKHSSNVVAEHLLLALGAGRFGWPATLDKGRLATQGYLKRLGLPPGTYRFENGSGLSRRSAIRPADLVRVLEGIYLDFGARAELLSALPLAGLDGTLQRRRFERSRIRARIRAKTGTLSGVSCLSGYAGGADGRVLLFTFLSGQVRRMPVVRWRQVALVGCLVDYLDTRL